MGLSRVSNGHLPRPAGNTVTFSEPPSTPAPAAPVAASGQFWDLYECRWVRYPPIPAPDSVVRVPAPAGDGPAGSRSQRVSSEPPVGPRPTPGVSSPPASPPDSGTRFPLEPRLGAELAGSDGTATDPPWTYATPPGPTAIGLPQPRPAGGRSTAWPFRGAPGTDR